MKHRLKGLLALVLSLVMVFALATNAWAVDYNIWVSGTQVNDANAANVLAGDAANDGKVSYDAANNTLTLNGVTISGSGEGIRSSESLTLQLMGSNKVDSSSSGSGVYVNGGTLTITGDGSLEAAGMSYGIANTAGTIIIENATVTATSTYNEGIHATGDLTITDATVTATGDSGIYAYTDVTIEDSTVTATATGDGGRGIHTGQGNITITGATVTATGGGDGGRGISAYDVSIENATVTAAGSATDDGSGNVTYGGKYGIYSSHTGNSSGGEVVIKNSTVTAKAGADGTGIRVEGVIGKTIIQNSTVDIGCKTGINSNYVAILADSSVTIKSTDKAISCSGLSFADTTDPALSDSTWYKWSTNGTAFTLSTATELTKEITAGTSTLYVVPLSGSAPGNPQPYPPYIYNPTPTPEPDKVTSSKTFDGGIASAVVVTILSATGGAWLAKKKD